MDNLPIIFAAAGIVIVVVGILLLYFMMKKMRSEIRDYLSGNRGLVVETKSSAENSGSASSEFEDSRQHQGSMSDQPDTLCFFAAVLTDQAKAAQGEEADSLFEQVFDKYKQALSIKPDKHEALHNWGTALLEQAKKTNVPKRKNLTTGS